MSNGNGVKVPWWDNGPRAARFEARISHAELMREILGPRMQLLSEYPHLPQISNEYE